jgi:hypothetical protein
MWLRHAALSLCAGIAPLACSSSEIRLPTGTTPDTTTGGVQRVSLTVQVGVIAADHALATQIGWQAGSVPMAQVTIRRSGSAQTLTRNTDSSGRVRFDDLLTGTYSVSAVRILSMSERDQLDPDQREVDAFGGAAAVDALVPESVLAIETFAGRRGSVVISEIWSGDVKVGNSFYDDGDFMELYNNGDAPVSLADKVIIYGFPERYDSPTYGCENDAPLQRDSLGIWTPFIYAFPPSALPIAPGAAVLLATDALDHTQISPLAFNLSRADFEFRGPADVDNPAVPDMISIGPRDGGLVSGHGLAFYTLGPVLAIGDVVDMTNLPRQTGLVDPTVYVRYPTSALLDVVTWTADIDPIFPSCGSPVHPSVDAAQARLITNWSVDLRSIARRSIGSLPDGRALLLRTKNSANDFVAAAPTPGAVP